MQIPLSRKVDKEIFRTIFIDHWESFTKRHLKYDTPQYEESVQKMLGCGKESGGYSEYRCVHCGRDVRRIGFSCKSCFCLSCAKKYVDDFVSVEPNASSGFDIPSYGINGSGATERGFL
jgi:hypothetical protein